MKKDLLVVMALFIFQGLTAQAANIDISLANRITEACMRSVETGSAKIQNYKAVCECIGDTHYKAAIQNTSQADAEKHMNWTAQFYETTDDKVLQTMVDQEDSLSSFDFQVTDQCMAK